MYADKRVFIVLLGPPGVGKGTQAAILSKSTGLIHISSGDLFRENIKNATDLGILAKTYMNKGELVPDDVTIAMIRDRLKQPDCNVGALLDGFPRTPAQADALRAMLKELRARVNLALMIDANAEEVAIRASRRVLCESHGHIFTLSETIQPGGKCPQDNSELYQRDDDRKEVVKKRIETYITQTAPLIAYYLRGNKLKRVDGMPHIEIVSASIAAIVGTIRTRE